LYSFRTGKTPFFFIRWLAPFLFGDLLEVGLGFIFFFFVRKRPFFPFLTPFLLTGAGLLGDPFFFFETRISGFSLFPPCEVKGIFPLFSTRLSFSSFHGWQGTGDLSFESFDSFWDRLRCSPFPPLPLFHPVSVVFFFPSPFSWGHSESSILWNPLPSSNCNANPFPLSFLLLLPPRSNLNRLFFFFHTGNRVIIVFRVYLQTVPFFPPFRGSAGERDFRATPFPPFFFTLSSGPAPLLVLVFLN